MGMGFGSYTYCRIKQIEILKVPKDVSGILLARVFLGFFVITTMFGSIFMLPFSLAMVLIFTNPISATAINFAFGGEKISIFGSVAIIFAMLGVVLMTNPGVFGFEDKTQTIMVDYPNYNLGIFFALLSSVCAGFVSLALRKIGPRINSHV